MSATATTRIPSDDSKKASGPPTLPKPCTTTRAPASGMPSSREDLTRATHHAARRGPRVKLHPADRKRLAGDRGRHRLTPVEDVDGVEEPGHHALVGVHVGCRNVEVGAEQRRDPERVAPGQPLELAVGQLPRVAHHAALSAAERDPDDGALEGHLRSESRDLVGGHRRVEADPALGRTADRRVVRPPPREDLDPAVVHAHRHRHLQDPLGVAQQRHCCRVDRDERRGVVYPVENRPPGVVLALTGVGSATRVPSSQPSSGPPAPPFRALRCDERRRRRWRRAPCYVRA